jgi:hypothetical protein
MTHPRKSKQNRKDKRMNQDQVINLIQTLFKVGSGALVAKGFGDDSLWEGIGGAVVAIVTWYLSHQWNKTPGPSPMSNVQSPTSGGAIHLLLVGLLGLSLCWTITGCNTPQRAAYVAVGGTQVSAETALGAWNIYVGEYHPPVATEAKVKAAYEKYQAAMAAVCDAGAIYAASGVTNSAGQTGAGGALATAQANAAQSLSDLIALLQTLGVKL